MIDDEEQQGLGDNISNSASSIVNNVSNMKDKINDAYSKINKDKSSSPTASNKEKPSAKANNKKLINGAKPNNSVKNGYNNAISKGFKKDSKDAIKDIAKGGVKEGAKAAGRSAAASGTAGASEVAYQISDKIKKAIDTIANNKDSSYTFLQIIIGVSIAIFSLMFLCVGFVASVMPGQVSSLYNTQITATDESKSSIGKTLQELLSMFSLTDEDTMNEYSGETPYKDSINQNVKMCKKYVTKAYDYQIEELLKKYCSDNDYDYELSVEKTKSLNSKENVVNNYNYAYLISIAGQTVDNTVEKFKVSDYKEYFKKNYIYLLQSQEKDHGEETHTDSLGNKYTVKYCTFEISCVPINTMYEIFKISPDSPNPIFDNAANSIVLPYSVYFFKEWAEQAGIDIGTDVNPTEFANSNTNESVDAEKLAELEKIYGDLSEQQQQIVKYAMSAVGCKYSQAHRLEEGIYDCSSLCARAYLTLGIQFGSKYSTSSSMCKYLVDHGCEISTSYNSSSAQPGDLIFWRDTWNAADINSRYRRVTHVSIYVGNGQMVSAASTKSGVVYKEVNLKDKIVSVCRPLYL